MKTPGAKRKYERKKYPTYTVYDRRTDMPVIIGGTARECAAAMGISLGSFYTIYTKSKNGSAQATLKWEIFRDEPDEEEENDD